MGNTNEVSRERRSSSDSSFPSMNSHNSQWDEVLAPRKKSKLVKWFEKLFGKINSGSDSDSDTSQFGRSRRSRRSRKSRRSRRSRKSRKLSTI
jgi:hypothetical protein